VIWALLGLAWFTLAVAAGRLVGRVLAHAERAGHHRASQQSRQQQQQGAA
jgi:hypothetical protein